MIEKADQNHARQIGERIAAGQRTWLFLDYDGTLAEFAPNPDVVLPDPELIALLKRLARHDDVLRLVVLSGRRFSHVLSLLPVPGVLLAGNYGIEFQTWEGKRERLVDFDRERPFLDQIKAEWQRLVGDAEDYYLEDKGYSVALHARKARDKEARLMIADATSAARQLVDKNTFRILGGYKFLEVAPVMSDKGQSLSMILKRFPWGEGEPEQPTDARGGAHIIYLGDDDKDEQAFKVVLKRGGTPIVVMQEEHPTLAEYYLSSPAETRCWLTNIAEVLDARRPAE